MAITVDIELEAVTCAECGITFAFPGNIVKERRRDHHTFYCPNGHTQYFPHKSDVEKAKAEAEALRGQLAASKQNAKYWRERKEEVERSRSALKGGVTRMKNRVANGVCPCCNRHFEDLQRHMETKHPGYAGEEA